ncbi:MAG: IclR family transcriptional regulator [Opitutales bacterium]
MAGRSIQRAFSLVRVLARSPRSLGLSELCAATELSKSTAHDLLQELIAEGMASQHPDNRRNFLAGSACNVFRDVLQHFSLTEEQQSRLMVRAEESGCSFCLCQLAGRHSVVTAAMLHNKSTDLLGSTPPAAISAAGKVLIARKSPDMWPEYGLTEEEASYWGARLNWDYARFEAEMKQVIEDNIAWNPGVLNEKEYSCATVLPISRVPEAALGAVMRKEDFDKRSTQEWAQLLQETARSLA